MTPDQDAILIMDRGFMDNMAYMTPEAYKIFQEKYTVDLDKIRDERYDMVIHMVTAANGAEKFYSLANNKARSETI